MKLHIAVGLSAFAFGLAGLHSSSASAAVLDNFTRANSTTLGPNWTSVSGSIGITSNNAEVNGGALTQSLDTFNGQTSSSVSIQASALQSTTTGFAGAVLGFASDADNLFVKIQQQGAANLFSNYAFYFGDNGINNSAWSGSIFNTLSTPFQSGQLTATLVGTTVTLNLTNLLDASNNPIPNQTYTALNVPTALLGSGIGIGEYGAATISSFGTTVPEPASLCLVGLGSLGLLRRRRI